jgi:hypothetical protein
VHGGLRKPDFLKIGEDLIAIAAPASPEIRDNTGLAGSIASLPAEQKDALFARVAPGDCTQAQALLLRRRYLSTGWRLPRAAEANAEPDPQRSHVPSDGCDDG